MSSSSAHRALLSLLAFVLILLSSAALVEAKPSAEEMKEAKALFKQAEEAAAAKNYLPSADLYLKAYDLFPSADFIFNAASMYQLAGDDENAKNYFEEYLVHAPAGRGSNKAKAAIAAYEAKRQEERELEAQRKEAEAKATAEKKAAQEKSADDEEARRLADQSTSAKSGGNAMRLPAIIGMSAGGVLVGVGVFFGLRSNKISDEVSKSSTFDPALEQRGKDAARNAYIFGGVGAAAIVGGAVLYVLGNRGKAKEGAVTLVPTLRSESIGVFAYGEF